MLAVAFAWKAAAPPAADSESARRLASGPHRVATFDTVFVDASRPTDANGDFAGAPERTLAATLWYPEGASDAHPLLVYSHGFMSMRSENAPLAALLASHGYVVVCRRLPAHAFRRPRRPERARRREPARRRPLRDRPRARVGTRRASVRRRDRSRAHRRGRALARRSHHDARDVPSAAARPTHRGRRLDRRSRRDVLARLLRHRGRPLSHDRGHRRRDDRLRVERRSDAAEGAERRPRLDRGRQPRRLRRVRGHVPDAAARESRLDRLLCADPQPPAPARTRSRSSAGRPRASCSIRTCCCRAATALRPRRSPPAGSS